MAFSSSSSTLPGPPRNLGSSLGSINGLIFATCKVCGLWILKSTEWRKAAPVRSYITWWYNPKWVGEHCSVRNQECPLYLTKGGFSTCLSFLFIHFIKTIDYSQLLLSLIKDLELHLLNSLLKNTQTHPRSGGI